MGINHINQNKERDNLNEFKAVLGLGKPNEFKTYEKAQEYFNNLPEKAKVLIVEYPKASGEFKPLAFYKPEITLKEKNDFEKGLKKETLSNTDFFPKPLKKQEKEEIIKDYFDISLKGIESVNPEKFTEYLLNTFKFKTIFGNSKELVYIYDKGIYTLKGKEIIKTFTEKELNHHCKNNLVTEILEKVKRKTHIDKDKFEKIPLNLIPLENGAYNFETEKLEEHSQDNYFKFKLPITYIKSAKCPLFINFLEETLYPEDIDLIQEWFGYCLYRKYIFKKGMIFFGETDTAKTTLLNILKEIIGVKNCSGLSLQNISGDNNFALASLYNKSLNFFDDLSSKDINDGGGFKIATGGGSITGEYKFGDQFLFHNYSKLLFACNKIPSPKEIDDNAYFSRWLPIAFDNQIPLEKQNQFFAEECLNKEKEGIFNWAIIGLKRLLENKRFSFNKTPNEVKNIMCRSGNPLVAFIQDKCNEQEGFFILKQDLYDKYCEYATKEKLPKMTKKMFGNNVKRHCVYITEGWLGKERGWRNIRVGGWEYDKLS